MKPSQSWHAWILSYLTMGWDAFEAAGMALVAGPVEALRLPAALVPLPSSKICASCARNKSLLVYGEDPDGFVLCRECRAPLFYCDIGGQG